MFYDNQICMHGNVKVCFNTDKYKCMRNWMLREKGVSWFSVYGAKQTSYIVLFVLAKKQFWNVIVQCKSQAVVCCWLLERNTFCVVLECKGWRFVFIYLMVIKTCIIVHYRADCFRKVNITRGSSCIESMINCIVYCIVVLFTTNEYLELSSFV